MVAARERDVMSFLRHMGTRVDGRKIKVSVLLGLLLGVFMTFGFSGNRKPAQGHELTSVQESLASIAAFLPLGNREPAKGAAAATAVVAEPALGPGDFLDASMELLLAAKEQTGGGPTVSLESGEELTFTILPELQATVERLYRSYGPVEAAFVAIDPRTGEVLAMTGFSDGQVSPQRALQAEGPAASIFKIVTAAALVEKYHVRPQKEVCYHGGRSGISKRLLISDPVRDNQCSTFSQAMGKSANVIFARLADKKLSRNDLKNYGEKFGFNRVIPFEWPIELSKMDVPEDRLEFARMAAGFHHSRLSPMHGALMAGAVANQGAMMLPRILKRVVGESGDSLYEARPEKLFSVMQESTAGKLASMMVTTTTQGTAHKYFAKRTDALDGIKVAGKTGSLSHTKDGERLYHSWLVGFAPADNPRIAFASLVVNGPKWRVKGPYIARKALDKFFSIPAASGSRAGNR